MRITGLCTAAAALIALAACGRTDDGDVVVERPGDVDVTTTYDTIRTPDLPDIDFGTTRDTVMVNRPTITINRDTTKGDTIR